MGRLVKGDVVVVPFPFSDLARSKRRPALFVQHFKGDDLLLAQITSKDIRDEYAIPLRESDFQTGSLNKVSNIRPNKLFTCSQNIVLYKIGSLKGSAIESVTKVISQMIQK